MRQITPRALYGETKAIPLIISKFNNLCVNLVSGIQLDLPSIQRITSARSHPRRMEPTKSADFGEPQRRQTESPMKPEGFGAP
jgi:hypothetical protein